MPENPISLNLARIVHHLMTHPRGWRVDLLMEELDIRDRTYRKYRQLLQKQFSEFVRPNGTSAVTEVKDGPYRYLRLVPDVRSAIHEKDFPARIAALYMAREVLSFLSDTSVAEELDNLLADFQNQIADHAFVFQTMLQNVDRLFHLVPFGAKSYDSKSWILEIILRALIFRRVVEIDYNASNGERYPRRIEPLTLASYRSGLYIIGRRVDLGEYRTYAVDRIEHVVSTKERFEYPYDYHPDDLTEGCFGLYRDPVADDVDIELIFGAEKWLQADLLERLWHPTQEFQHLDDGRLRMTFSVNTFVEVRPWVRSFGSNVEIVRPAPDAEIWIG